MFVDLSMKNIALLFFLFIVSCNSADKVDEKPDEVNAVVPVTVPSLVILGTIQDAGSPHVGCKKECCRDLWVYPDESRMVVSLGIIDPENKMNWMIEATPDFPKQMKMLNDFSFFSNEPPSGIFLTHAHIGHYTGLMYLGREGLGSKDVKVYAMPRMKSYLEKNGPWSQLVELHNIQLQAINANEEMVLSTNIKITPFLVPHRDEFSETVGYVIHGPTKKVLFIPDIDKWSKWERSLVEEIAKVDYAFIDGPFYDAEEMNHRDINEIPHPFVIETMALLEELPGTEKSKIYLIHFNHTNPLLNVHSEQTKIVLQKGYSLAQQGSVFPL